MLLYEIWVYYQFLLELLRYWRLCSNIKIDVVSIQ